jgi:hypothetical protein
MIYVKIAKADLISRACVGFYRDADSGRASTTTRHARAIVGSSGERAAPQFHVPVGSLRFIQTSSAFTVNPDGSKFMSIVGVCAGSGNAVWQPASRSLREEFLGK